MLSVPPAADAVVAAAALATASGADAPLAMPNGAAVAAAAAAAAAAASPSHSFSDMLQAQMMAAYMPNMHNMPPQFYPQAHMFAPFDTTKDAARELNNSSPTSDSKRARWTAAEDEQLKTAVAASGGRNWKLIAQSAFGNKKSDVQCLHRWQKVLDPKLVKGPWTAEEDAKVVALVAEHGPQKWSLIASHLPGRIGKQCRERWHNHLNPNIKKEAWTPEEDQILMLLQQRIGSQWALMTKYLPGRPDNSIKNRFNSSMKRKYAASGAALAVPDADGMINLPGFGLVALPTLASIGAGAGTGAAKAEEDDGEESDEEVKTATKKKNPPKRASASTKGTPDAGSSKKKTAVKRETASATKATNSGKKATRPSARKSLAAATAAAAAAVTAPPAVLVSASGRPRRATKKPVQSESESDDADRTDDEDSFSERKDNPLNEHALDRTDDDTSDVDDDLHAGVFNKELSANAHVPSTPAHQRSNGANARHGRDSTTNLLQTPRNSLLSTPQNRNHSRASSHSSGSNGLKLQMYDSTPMRGKMSSPTLALSLASPSARELLSSPAISSAQLFSPPAAATLQRLRPLSTPLHHPRYHNMMTHSQRTPGIMPASPGHLLSVPMGVHSTLVPPQTPNRVMSLLASPSAFISTPAGAKLEHHVNEELVSANVGGGAAHAADAAHADSDEPALKKQRTQQLTSPTPGSTANSNGASTPYLSASSSSFLSARPLLNTPLMRFSQPVMTSTPSIGGSSASTLRTQSLSLTTPSPSFDSFFQQSPMRASRRGKRGLEFGADELATPASARSAASHESPVGFASPPPVRDHSLPIPMTDVPLCHVQQSSLLPASAVSAGGAIGLGMGTASVNALLRELRQSAAAAAVVTSGRSSSTVTAEPSTPAHTSSPLESEATPRVPGGASRSTSADTPDAPVSAAATSDSEQGPIPSFDHAAINELRVEGKGLTLHPSSEDADMPPVCSTAQSKLLATPVSKKSVRDRRTQDLMGSPSLNMLAACCPPVVTSS